MIRCGHCGKRHGSVSDVRECFYEREQERRQAQEETYAENAYIRMMENTGIGLDPRDLYDAPW